MRTITRLPDKDDDIMTGIVANNHSEIVQFFGLSDLFKLFYEQLKLDADSYQLII